MTVIAWVILTPHWQINRPLEVGSLDNLLERIKPLGELSQFAIKLNEPMRRMSFYFPSQPPEDHLHIVVQKPVVSKCFSFYFTNWVSSQ